MQCHGNGIGARSEVCNKVNDKCRIATCARGGNNLIEVVGVGAEHGLSQSILDHESQHEARQGLVNVRLNCQGQFFGNLHNINDLGIGVA